MTCIFVTGTDTEVGKTLVSAALLERLNQAGAQTLAMKPIAAGAENTAVGLRNEDALQLALAMNARGVSYDEVNPICLQAPVAPHLAAAQEGLELTVAEVLNHYRQLTRHPHDIVLVEGAGGWLVPLNATETLADVAVALGAGVVLVVGMQLGCLNHAMLTAAQIKRQGLKLVGWVANHIHAEPMALASANEQWLTDYLGTQFGAPKLASITYQTTADAKVVADYLPGSQALMSLLRGNTDF